MKAENKIIALTGAGSGIGRELTFALLEKGAKVAAVDINEAALKKPGNWPVKRGRTCLCMC